MQMQYADMANKDGVTAMMQVFMAGVCYNSTRILCQACFKHGLACDRAAYASADASMYRLMSEAYCMSGTGTERGFKCFEQHTRRNN